MAQRKDKEKKPRQSWTPHWSLSTLYKVWMVIFTAFKIALGAAATVLLIVVICGLSFAGTLGDYLQEDVIPFADMVIENYDVDEPSYLYHLDSDGQIKVLQRVYADIESRRAEFDEIPKHLIHAAVAIEDKRFYEHQGVDWFTTVKAVVNMFFGDETVGGSSITQQLIKNVTEEDSVTVQRKVLEFFRAVNLEKKYDKDAIMTMYLNYIYMGQGCRGVKSAAATYFGKELQMLTLAECASLISITNNPSLFDPYSDDVFEFRGEMMDGMQRNQYRQRLVLDEMLSQGWITQEEYDEAIAQELVLKNGIDHADRIAKCPKECGFIGTNSQLSHSENQYYCPNCGTQILVAEDSSEGMYSWFVEAVLEDVAMDLCAKDDMPWNDTTAEMYKELIERGGYHIYTTLDMCVQNQLDKIYEDLNEIPDTYSGQQLWSGMVIIDNRTGDVVALSGNVGEKTVYDAYSMATDSKHQSGSSIKPVSVYAPGFELGTLTPATVVKDLPYFYDAEDNGTPWPYNDNRIYNYSRTIYSAIVNSVNAVAVNSLELIGPSYGFNFAKDKFGLSTLIERYEDTDGKILSDIGLSPLAMGAQTRGVTVKDMTAAFATFANNGVYREARTYSKVYDTKGALVYENEQDSQEILSKKTVDYTNYCLVNAVNYGTGGLAQIPGMTVAGKTGSTSSFRDRWFCGFTGYYTASVWCGYETPETINPVGGNYNVAAKLWNKVMAPLHSGKSNVSLYNQGKMTSVSICLDSGKLATEACTQDIRSAELGRVESVLLYPEDVPSQSCDKHYSVELCKSGDGVASEYCKKFASVNPAMEFTPSALVRLTQSEVDELLAAEQFGLNPQYLRDDYVYLTDDSGNPVDYHGFHGGVNAGFSAPYKICTVHTKADWEAYEASLPSQPQNSQTPSTSRPDKESSDSSSNTGTADKKQNNKKNN